MSVSWRDSLVRRYRLNDDYTDAAGNEDGTAVGNPTFIDPLFQDGGKSISLDGDDGVDCGPRPTLTNAMQIVSWVKPTVANDGTSDIIVACYNTGGNQRMFAFVIDSTNAPSVGSIAILLGNVTTGAFKAEWGTAGGQISQGVLAQIGVTFNAGTVTIYRNGIDVPSSLLNGATPDSSLFQSTANLTIGHWLVNGSPASFVQGNIDDVGVVNSIIGDQFFRDNWIEGHRWENLRSPESAYWRQLATSKGVLATAFDYQLPTSGYVLAETIRDTTLAHGEGQGTGIASNGGIDFGGGKIELNGTDDYIELNELGDAGSVIDDGFVFSQFVQADGPLVREENDELFVGISSGQLVLTIGSFIAIGTRDDLADGTKRHILISGDSSGLLFLIDGVEDANSGGTWPSGTANFSGLVKLGEGSGNIWPPKLMFGAKLTDAEAESVFAIATGNNIVSASRVF